MNSVTNVVAWKWTKNKFPLTDQIENNNTVDHQLVQETGQKFKKLVWWQKFSNLDDHYNLKISINQKLSYDFDRLTSPQSRKLGKLSSTSFKSTWSLRDTSVMLVLATTISWNKSMHVLCLEPRCIMLSNWLSQAMIDLWRHTYIGHGLKWAHLRILHVYITYTQFF